MDGRPLLLGHRGARGEKSIPENTLASFDLALESGCDGFEFDVRLTGDRQAVLNHNANFCRLDISRHSGTQLALPQLHQVLSHYQRSAFLDIELKVSGLEAITIDLLRKIPPARGFVVSSFLPEVLTEVHRMDSAVPLGLICETPVQFRRWRELPLRYLILHHKLFQSEKIDGIRAGGMKIFVWTVNAQAQMKRFTRLGVDGIISDYPQALALAFGRHAQKY